MNQVARPRPTGRQLVRFAVIGAASAAAYLLLYLLLRTVTGAQVANVVALVVTQVANTATNRRITFGLRGLGGGAAAPGRRAGGVRLRARRSPRARSGCCTTSTRGPDGSPRSPCWWSRRASHCVRFLTLHAMMARRPATGASPRP